MSPWGPPAGFIIIILVVSVLLIVLSAIFFIKGFLLYKNNKKRAQIWFLFALILFGIDAYINRDGLHRLLIEPIQTELKKCKTDIVLHIDGHKLLVPRNSVIYKTKWMPEKNTREDCFIREIKDVQKVYWRNLKISSSQDYRDPNQTWWDWRQYEMSIGQIADTSAKDLKLIEIPQLNKEIYIYEAGSEYTKNKEPILFDCYGLERNFANQNPHQEGVYDDEELGFDKYDLFSNEGKYCYTSYLHKSGLVFSYGFLRKAHRAEYTPKEYTSIDQNMREQLSEYLYGAEDNLKNIQNFTKDIVTYRFAGSTDDERRKESVSYDCVGGVTVHIGENHLRVPRSRKGAPTLFQPRIKDIGRIGGNPGDPVATLPQNDCSVEYVENVIRLDQVWGPYSFFALDKQSAFQPTNETICRGTSCSGSFIHPDGFGVGYKFYTKDKSKVDKIANELIQGVDDFVHDAHLIPIGRENVDD